MSNTLKIIKLNFIKDLGDPDLMRNLLALYEGQIAKGKGELFELFENKSWYLFGKLCHKIKGSVVIFGLNELATQLKIIQLTTEQFAKIDLLEKVQKEPLDLKEEKMLKELNDVDVDAIRVRYYADWNDMEDAIQIYEKEKSFEYITKLFNEAIQKIDISILDVREILTNFEDYLR